MSPHCWISLMVSLYFIVLIFADIFVAGFGGSDRAWIALAIGWIAFITNDYLNAYFKRLRP